MSLQEKFQVISPSKPEPEVGWVEPTFVGRNSQGARTFMPSENIQDGVSHFTTSLSGQTDVSKDTNPGAMKTGFTRKEMNGCDDSYTGEHVDHFYGEAVGDDGKAGFVERNNYLDRM